MRLLFANVVSALVHLGVLGALAFYIPRSEMVQAEFTLVRGEPITATFSLPSAAEQQVEVELEPEAEPVSVAEPAPPANVQADETRPSDQSLPDIDAVPLERVLDRPTEESLVATEPLASPTELTETEIDADPATAPEIVKTEQPVERPDEPPTKPQRTVRPVEIARQPSIAMPFQQAVQVGVKVDQMPRKLPANRPPNYPPEALLAGIEGRVMLRVLIGGDGLVQSAAVHASSGAASLDRAAIEAVRHWRFSPARRAGNAVAYEVLVPVRFSILGG